MKFFHKSHHQQAADRIRAYKDFYEFHKVSYLVVMTSIVVVVVFLL